MDITHGNVYGGPNIGIYAVACDGYLLVPSGFTPSKAQDLADALQVPWHAVSVSGTRLSGAMSVHVKSKILLPKTVLESEYDILSGVADVHIIDVRYTALGNLICANRRGAIVSPLLNSTECRIIQDVLDVEVVRMGIAGMEQSGSLAKTNDVGTVVHPLADEHEMQYISDVLHTRVEPSTINNGVPYVASGILANNKAIVVGGQTTGPEIMMLTRAFIG
ncbi:MAG: translation initiation factor IF-6 [Cenarchaeum sp. SB0661_bin_35]|nr:translation initiation factor IF-6 [Cenarchaeum sp. SB0667_bin_13]MYC79311.1 translation initiation factor IF-6 [Cenarchaeum sp. SB0661_bin_35]